MWSHENAKREPQLLLYVSRCPLLCVLLRRNLDIDGRYSYGTLFSQIRHLCQSHSKDRGVTASESHSIFGIRRSRWENAQFGRWPSRVWARKVHHEPTIYFAQSGRKSVIARKKTICHFHWFFNRFQHGKITKIYGTFLSKKMHSCVLELLPEVILRSKQPRELERKSSRAISCSKRSRTGIPMYRHYARKRSWRRTNNISKNRYPSAWEQK